MKRVLAVVALALLCAGCLDGPQSVTATSTASSRPEVARPAPTVGPLLHAAPNGDGDSWKDTQGREYRLTDVQGKVVPSLLA